MLELAEIRGGTVRVTSCRDGKLVGRRGVEARVTARAAHLVAGRRSETGKRVDVIVAPRKVYTQQADTGMHSGAFSVLP